MTIRQSIIGLAMFMVLFITGGCGSLPAYQPIDLDRDLNPQTLERYKSTFEDMREAEHHHNGMVKLEHTNWWLSGLIAYYRRGTVMRIDGTDGPVYHIMNGWGLGPLSVIFSSASHATFDSDGRRLSGMRMDNALFGHLAMSHSGDSLLANGQKEEYHSMHLFHHIFNWHRMNDHSYVSLFTVPNALGFTLPHDHRND